MKHAADIQQFTPKRARSALVALLPGGKQDFPDDPIAMLYRERLARAQADKVGRKLTRRIPQEA